MTWLTTVFCLPGTKVATLSVFPPGKPSQSVHLDRDQAIATRDALTRAIDRMPDPRDERMTLR